MSTNILTGYDHFGGIHPETANIANCLRYLGVANPATGKPFSEAMLFGIAGGLGACYILWEFKEYSRPAIVFGFQHQSNYPVRYVTSLCERIGIQAEFMRPAASRRRDRLSATRWQRTGRQFSGWNVNCSTTTIAALMTQAGSVGS